jgi:hypothetical protein
MFLSLIFTLVENLGIMHIVRTSSRGREGFTKSVRKRTPMGWGLKSNVRTLFMQEIGKTTEL